MKCRVCGFEGEFEQEPYISRLYIETTGNVKDYDGYRTTLVEGISETVKILHVCPVCRVVTLPKEEGLTD